MTLTRLAALALTALAISACQPSHDARQIVKQNPSAVYAAFADAFSENSYGGASQYSDLWHGGMQTDVDKTSDSKLDVVTKFDGDTATEAHFTFTPQDGGKATLVEADVNVDQAVMRKAFAGTGHEQLGNTPRLAFAQGMQRLIARYASRIEAGMPLNDASSSWMTGDTPSEFYDGMSEDAKAQIRQEEQEERQDAASAPMVDPNADAKRYIHAGGSSD